MPTWEPGEALGEKHRLHHNELNDLGGGGVTDHGALTGLSDDDHPQYATDADLASHAATPHTASTIPVVRYAKPTGNNGNDGLTWDTAKKDILGAYDALPSNGGTICFDEQTYCDAVNTDRGLWLVGPSDPSYASPPTGWRQAKSLRLVGVGQNWHANGHEPSVALLFGGSGTDRAKPTIWLAGTSAPIELENVHIQYPAVGIRLGMRADGSNEVASTANVTLRNVGVSLNQIPGNGPGIELGYVFWLFAYDCVFDGNANGHYTLTAASITSGTTARFTTSIAHSFVPGDTVYVHDVTPSAYNGNWTVTAVTGTTFDANIGSSPAVGSAFGQVQPTRSYRRAAIGHDTIERITGGTPIASGLIHLDNCNFNGGHFHYAPSGATSSGRVIIRNSTFEGDFSSNPMPPLLDVRAGGVLPPYLSSALGGIQVQNVELADGNFVDGAVRMDGEITRHGDQVVTHATSMSPSSPGGLIVGAVAPNRRVGNINAESMTVPSQHAMRSFGAVTVPWTNLISQDASTHPALGGDGTITTGIKGPDGTTNAFKYHAGSANRSPDTYRAGTTFTVGDFVIAGIWRRYYPGGGTPDGNDYPLIAGAGSGFGGFEGGAGFFVLLRPSGTIDDGGWSWLSWGAKITSATGASHELIMSLRVAAGHEVDYCYPVLMHIPAASVQDEDDVRDFIRYFRAFPDGVSAGNVSLMRGQNLIQPGPGAFIEQVEGSDPAAPAANKARMFTRDNGAGKTQLCVRFATGAVQVLATEP